MDNVMDRKMIDGDEVTTTWNYCHLECGSSYVYQENEKVEVSLNSLSQEAFELAVERLQTIEKNM